MNYINLSVSEFRCALNLMSDYTFLSSIDSISFTNHTVNVKPGYWKLPFTHFLHHETSKDLRRVFSYKLKTLWINRFSKCSATKIKDFLLGKIYNSFFNFKNIIIYYNDNSNKSIKKFIEKRNVDELRKNRFFEKKAKKHYKYSKRNLEFGNYRKITVDEQPPINEDLLMKDIEKQIEQNVNNINNNDNNEEYNIIEEISDYEDNPNTSKISNDHFNGEHQPELLDFSKMSNMTQKDIEDYDSYQPKQYDLDDFNIIDVPPAELSNYNDGKYEPINHHVELVEVARIDQLGEQSFTTEPMHLNAEILDEYGLGLD